jgi:hypothetical protein
MAAVGADRFRPHFLTIERDDMVDAFKSGAAIVVFYSLNNREVTHGPCRATPKP